MLSPRIAAWFYATAKIYVCIIWIWRRIYLFSIFNLLIVLLSFLVSEVVTPEARVLLLFCVIRCNVDVPADTGNLNCSSMLMARCEFFNVFACIYWSGL